MEENRNININNKIISGVGWKIAERLISQLISFFVTIVLARLLTPTDYGVVAMVNVFVIIADTFILSGFTAALIQKQQVTEDDYSTVFYLNLFISIVMYLILFFCAPFISKVYNIANLTLILRVIALKLPLSALYSVQSAYVSRNMNFKKFFFSTSISTLISGIVGVVLAKNGFGVWALVFQQLISLVVSSLVLSFTIKWKPTFVFSKRTIRETRGFGVRIMATDFIGTTFSQLTSFVIGLFYTTEDLAYYTKGRQLPDMATGMLTASLTAVLFPAMSSVIEEKNKLKNMLRSSTKIISFIMTPILLGIFIVASDLITVLFTSKWLSATIFLQIMCIASIILMLGEFDIVTLKALGKSKAVLILEFIKKPLFVLIVFIAVQFGVVWIASSIILINLLALLVNTFVLKRAIGYGIMDKIKDCLSAILLSLAMVASVYLVGLIPLNSITLRLIIKVIVGVVVYLSLATIMRNKELDSIVKFLKSKIFNREKNKYKKGISKNMRNLFICNTVYQIIVACSIASKSDCVCDIIISDHSKSMEKVVENIRKNGEYFKNCNFITTKDFCVRMRNKRVHKKSLLKKLNEKGYLIKYDNLFMSNWDAFSWFMYSRLKKINGKIKLNWFEDGFGTYSRNIGGQYFEKPTLKRRVYNLVIYKNKYFLYDEVDSLYLFNPELLDWESDRSIKIKTIELPDEGCKTFLNQVFEYNKLRDKYDKKLIFFQDGYKDFNDTLDVDTLEIIAKEIGKENIFVKSHPRDTTNKFKNRGFQTNKDTYIPAELIILNECFENTTFATFYSQSIITAATLFGKKIKSIILSKLNRDDGEEDPYFTFLNKKIYSQDKNVYFVPKTTKDLIKIIKKG